MSHNTVTPDPQKDMPRQQGLLLRGSRWYSNFKVPLDLRAAFGKQHIRESLGTSDHREAARKIAYERARWTATFEQERKKLAASLPQPAPAEKRLLTVVSKQEAYELATRYLVSREAEMRSWMDHEGRINPDKREAALENVSWDASDAEKGGYDSAGKPIDGSGELQAFLVSLNIECAVSSPAFETLRSLFLEAHSEYLSRSVDMLNGSPIEERSNLFRGVHSHSPAIDNQQSFTIDDLIKAKERANVACDRSEKTIDSFVLPARLFREVLGKNKLLSAITREDMHRLFEVVRQMPLNAVQRYKGMTAMQAIEAAKIAGDNQRLKQNSLWNIYVHMSAAFSFAVEEKMMAENPAASRLFRQMFKKERAKTRAQFTIDQLNKLFRAPLYTGCLNDRNGYSTPGTNQPKRGRFWVPLLALFHGMRNNEACQIYTADVKAIDGIPFIAIREEQEDSATSEKKLKTEQSIRDVPVHPELLKMGFLEFVAERRRDASSPRLFPELTAGHNGYFSDAFSKWFGRFVADALGDGCEATMHSFRHQFRDATRAARLPDETVGRLAGWEHGKAPSSLQMHQYGRGAEYFRTLAEDLAKVKYPGLDLSHLYTASAPS